MQTHDLKKKNTWFFLYSFEKYLSFIIFIPCKNLFPSNRTNLYKNISDEKDKLELSRDRLEVEIESLRVDLKEKMNLQKNYERNIEYIEKNRNLENKILGYNQLLEKLNKKRDGIRNEIQDLKNDNKVKKEINTKNKSLIEQILREEEVLKIFEIYNTISFFI